jgi:hypothetical protein
MYLDIRSKKMKSFIRAITIVIVLTFLPKGSITPLSALTIATERDGGVIDVFDDEPASRSNDAVVQLRTLLSTTNQQHGGGKVLVIPTAEIKPQDMVTLMEDMTVMCRIFDKKLAQSNLVPGMPFVHGVRFSNPFSRDSQSMGAMYVQGYGALFMRTVDFPLSAPPQTEEQEETEEEDADPVWEQMKREMFSPQETARQTPGRQGEEYDARKVKNLKSTLIKALVHAANIRGLKTDESVTITVISKSSQSAPLVTRLFSSGERRIIATAPGGKKAGSMSPTVLTIRAKKSYIDALAQKQIDFDKFEEKIQLLSYPCLGENLSRDFSPSFLRGETISITPGTSSAGSSSGRRRVRSSGIDSMEHDHSEVDSVGQSSSRSGRR